MIHHALSVKKKIKMLYLWLICQGKYANPSIALKNSKYLMKKTKCHGVKIESNKKNYNDYKKISKAKFLLWVILDLPHNLK